MNDALQVADAIALLFFDSAGAPKLWFFYSCGALMLSAAIGIRWIRKRFCQIEEFIEIQNRSVGWKSDDKWSVVGGHSFGVIHVSGVLPSDKSWKEFKKAHRKFVSEFNKQHKRDLKFSMPK